MEKTIRKFASHGEQKAEIYRYWRSRPVGERLEEVWDATQSGYGIKGIQYDATRRHEATVERLQRAPG